jgi:hypothetical protein
MRKLVLVFAIAACGKGDKGSDDYATKSKQTEVTLQLNKLSKLAKRSYGEVGEFVKGKAGPTPSKPCCSYPDQKCPVTDEWRNDKVWQQLEFSIDEPSRFQYTYQSDGKTVAVTGTGDVDCSGTPQMWKLDASVNSAGNVVVNLTLPGAK